MPLSNDDAEQQIVNFSAFDVVVIGPPMIRAAIALVREHQVSLWDALIIEAARLRGCARLLSEDLQDGRTFGTVRIENPFR